MVTPREFRLLKSLAEDERVFVKDLRQQIGALNPAQIASQLRKQGWIFTTGFIAARDRDGKPCRPGYYSMDPQERERAHQFLIEIDRAAATARSDKISETRTPKDIKTNISEERKYD